MASYLLLRNNKETGPHSLDDLRKLGLKPYDLVWVEGKSAAWRYPSEIDELKPFSPVAEEQPFDRFFKKPTEEKEAPAAGQHSESSTRLTTASSSVIPGIDKYAPVGREETPVPSPKRSVFVTMPGNSHTSPVTSQKPVVPPRQETGHERPAEPVRTPNPVQSAKTPIPVDDEPEAAHIKFSQPLDEIKEMYVKTLQQRKTRIARKSFLLATLKKVAVIAALVGVGVLTGFIIRSKSPNPAIGTQEMIPASTAALTSQPQTASEENNTAIPQPDVNDETETLNRYVKAETSVDKPLIDKLADPKQPVIRVSKEMMLKPLPKKEYNEQQVSPGAETDPLTGERLRKLRTTNDAMPEVKTRPAVKGHHLIEQVIVSSNDYKRVAFGGIRNLQLTVTNHSKYELDQVIVELHYLKPSEEPLRTENIRFNSIAPNESATVKIPDTNRGIKVSYKIISIESKQSADDVAGR